MAKTKHVGTRILGWLILVALAAAPFLYLSLHEEIVKVTAARVTRGRVEQTVTAIASGTVKSKLDSLVASGFMGTVVKLPVEEGNRVQEGDVLIELNHTDLDAQVALAEANLRVGQSRLEQTKLGATINEEIAATRVSQTSAQFDQARANFNRVKTLMDKNAISRSDFDTAELAFRVAQESAAAAVASQKENLVRQEEIRSAQAGIEQLEAAIAVAKAMREKAFVRAPFPGVVARVITKIGQSVTVGMPLVQLVRDESLYVEAPFDEANAAEIQVGQKVRINLDAYRSVDFWGRVTAIFPTVTMNPDLSRTLTVNILVEQGKERFMPGMSADVIVIVNEKDDVLFAPTEALIREQYAYVVNNGRAEKREVTLGVGNWNTIEILGGLAEGDLLITSLSIKELKEGVKVEVVDKLETQ